MPIIAVMKRTVLVFITVVLSGVSSGLLRAQPADTTFVKEASTVFGSVERICRQDSGRLWGRDLCCPLVIARRESRAAVSNCEHLLARSIPYNGLYYGFLDDTVVIAGTACAINGTVCAMLPWELAANTGTWQAFLHEMFHAFQNNKGWKYVYDNSHLDRPDARVLLSCEMRALLKALASDSAERRRYLTEALFFRRQRNRISPEKAMDESHFEMHEGLADYTQYRLCLPSDEEIVSRLSNELSAVLNQDGFSRSYGYTVGAVYAFFNDVRPGWRLCVDTLSSLSMLTQRIYGIDIGATDSANVWEDYCVDSLLVVEDSIFQVKIQVKEKVYQAIEQNNVLVLDYDGCQFGFNPNHVVGFDEGKNFYQFMEIRGDFGVVYTVYGCLLSDKIYVLIPDGVVLQEKETYPERFSLQLNKGWRIDGNSIISSIKQ